MNTPIIYADCRAYNKKKCFHIISRDIFYRKKKFKVTLIKALLKNYKNIIYIPVIYVKHVEITFECISIMQWLVTSHSYKHACTTH